MKTIQKTPLGQSIGLAIVLALTSIGVILLMNMGFGSF